MTIKTKFNIGDTVFGISYQHKLVEFRVGKIFVSAKDNDIEIDYYKSDDKNGCDFVGFSERYCFASKDEAVAYIKGE